MYKDKEIAELFFDEISYKNLYFKPKHSHKPRRQPSGKTLSYIYAHSIDWNWLFRHNDNYPYIK